MSSYPFAPVPGKRPYAAGIEQGSLMVHAAWFKERGRLLFSRSGTPWVKWLALGGFAFFLIKGLIWLGVLAAGIMVAFQW